MCGHFNKDILEELVNASWNNPHDWIAWAIMSNVGLMMLGKNVDIMPTFKNMIADKD